MTHSMLAPRDWREVTRKVREAEPFHTAVVDGVFTAESLEALRTSLLADPGWGVLDWGPRWQTLADQFLHNSRPRAPLIRTLVDAFRQALPELLDDLALVSHWAILCRQDRGILIHADHAAIVINLWLTDDVHNQLLGKGGMTMFDVMRDPSLTYPAFVQADFCERYVAERTRGKCLQVPYHCNRAVIFDGRVMHASQQIRFAAEVPAGARLNLSLAFDDPRRHPQLFP